jgi:hypothetical protein
VNRFPSRELEEIASEWQSLLSGSYLERLKFVTNHEQTISDFCQRPIPRVHAEQILMKARVKKMQFLEYK